MTNKKITDLVELTTPTTDDVFPLVDIATNSTKKAQLANLPISTATQTALDAKQATLVSGTNIKTINSTSLLGSGNISIAANPAGTAGQIQFSDGSAFAADSNLYWDNTNKRLGVRTNAPTSNLSISSTSATILDWVRPSSGSGYLSVTNIRTGGGVGTVFGSDSFSFRNPSLENYIVSESNRVGIGTNNAAVTARLQVKGSGSTSATTSLLVQNSSAQTKFFVDDSSVGASCSIGNLINGYSSLQWNANGVGFGLISGGGLAAKLSNTASFVISDSTSPSNTTSAKLVVDSTNSGFLPPRMTTTQKNAIATPAAGLMVYDTDTNKLCCYNGTTWNDLF